MFPPPLLDTPPPLQPRPHQREEDQSLPPLPRSKPRSKMIRQGAISLPRKRTEFREHARRRGSYHDVYKSETGDEVAELCIEADEKVGHSDSDLNLVGNILRVANTICFFETVKYEQFVAVRDNLIAAYHLPSS